LDIVWLTDATKYHRLQTAYAKHNKRVNVIYVDGHSGSSLPSKLTWGQFYGKFTGVMDNGYAATATISSPALDGVEWSSTPE